MIIILYRSHFGSRHSVAILAQGFRRHFGSRHSRATSVRPEKDVDKPSAAPEPSQC